MVGRAGNLHCISNVFDTVLIKQMFPQNYPLHGSEVNGFHPAPTTYSHTPTINGEGIMGENLKQMLC